ncbi:right-handed parallel beta-helix repeat-containing protein [Paenibacillus macquariensis]|uniref:Probable pectate lyase C n=1 Tax=Paenibacillus macquariensis TaxID=948756 RepID=A0ABY1JL72_9BACL|nr:cohesin domain-containing protein [Paenibacillus macquariensis]MEC0090013.1 cohesin domain-containing protein [Paenibacillus macquariensis]OAB31103.1 hypothetical protein PMSM_20480 [Paenibacillus macquariensis subsp. macquariensis]SIQ36099.1 Ig-like domain (group 2) [Paenibacillus macquariensis]
MNHKGKTKGSRWAIRSINLLMILILFTGMTITTFAAPVKANAAGTELYVSLTGSDETGDGTIGSPFATLEGAREAIRELKSKGQLPNGGVTVYLRGGVYPRNQSFVLNEEDSGTDEAPIVYRAYPGENVSIFGGATMDTNGFKPVTDASVRKRLSTTAVDKIYQFDLRAQGFTNFGEIIQGGFGLPTAPEPPELFFNENVLMLARYPNIGTGDGFLRIGQLDDPGADPRNSGVEYNVRPLPPSYDHGATFRYLDDRPSKWSDTSDIWMFGYWFWDWADGTLQIKDINKATKQISTTKASVYSVKAGQRYYYFNILEELDAPGEYYLDRNSGILYLYPPTSLDGSEIEISLLGDPLVSMNEVSNITFQGIKFGLTRGTAIEMQGGSNNIITDSTFLKIGDKAVTILDGHHNGVTNSEIYGTGKGGILLDGGNRTTLTPGENYVVNNSFHDFSRIQRTYTPAVNIMGVGNRVANNLIYDAPHEAIQFVGNNHIIEYNEIYNVVNETGDAGAIYGGRDWSAQGTIIRYNYIHDIGNKSGSDEVGIYLDDMLSGITIYGNILSNVDYGIMVGGGRNNIVENNVISNNRVSISLDVRGLGWAAYHCTAGGALLENLAKVPYKEDPWLTYYPNLKDILTDSPCTPKYNSVQKNVIYKSADKSIAGSATASGYFQDNWKTTEDIGFIDSANGNWNLREDAAVFTQIPGFESIPFDKIGLNKGVKQDDMLTQVSMYSPTRALIVGNSTTLWVMGNSATGRYINLFGHMTFKSDHPKIAEVGANGVVRAVAPGNTQISVTALVDGVIVSDVIPLTIYESNVNFIDGFDGFEDGLIHWETVKGSPTTSTEKAHSGMKSFKVNQDLDVIKHPFKDDQNKILTLWFYDNLVSGSQVMANVTGVDGAWRGIGLSLRASTTNYVKRIDGATTSTNVVRTTGWHEFKWDYTSGTHVDMYIDDVLIASPTGVTAFNEVAMGDWWQGDAVSNVYFDDISITDATLYERIELRTLSDLNIGETKQVQVSAYLPESDVPMDVTGSSQFTSSQTDIATVTAGGLITALKEGESVITATYGSLTAAVKLQVQMKEEQPTAVLTGPSTVLAGQPFTVNFGLSNITSNVYGQDITIEYDTALVEYVSSTAMKTGVDILSEKANPGKIRMILASQGANHAVIGSAELVKLSFKAKSVAQTTTGMISVTGALLGDEQGREFQAHPASLSVEVTTSPPGVPGDSNGDNRITIGDLAFAAANYGKDDKSADWNQIKTADIDGNKVIDIMDLAAIAKKILE